MLTEIACRVGSYPAKKTRRHNASRIGADNPISLIVGILECNVNHIIISNQVRFFANSVARPESEEVYLRRQPGAGGGNRR